MKVTIRFFARARELAGADTLTMTLREGATVAELRQEIARLCPSVAGLLARSRLAVNEDFADDATVLPFSCEVAVLPPVSGGAGFKTHQS